MLTARLRTSNGKAKYFKFLIDSGADYTLISRSDALIIGIDYSELNSQEIEVEVANLTFIHAKKTTLIITIENQDLTIPVLIAKEDVECLLGRKGIFDKFDVTFKEREQIVIFKS